MRGIFQGVFSRHSACKGSRRRQGSGGGAALSSRAHHRTHLGVETEVIGQVFCLLHPRKRSLISSILPKAGFPAPCLVEWLLWRRPLPVTPMIQHLPRIFHPRLLTRLLVPGAQGPRHASGHFRGLSGCRHLRAAAASGASATRPSASRPTYFPAPAPQTAAEVRFPCPLRSISCLASEAMSISGAPARCWRAPAPPLAARSMPALPVGTCPAFSTAAC